MAKKGKVLKCLFIDNGLSWKNFFVELCLRNHLLLVFILNLPSYISVRLKQVCLKTLVYLTPSLNALDRGGRARGARDPQTLGVKI